MEGVLKKADISEGITVDEENLANLRFADDVALFKEKLRPMEKHLNSLNWESLKVGLKIHKGKTKMTNYADSQDIIIDQENRKKWQNSNTSDKPHTTKILQKKKSMPGWMQHGSVLEKKPKEKCQDRQLPISLEKQAMDQCVLSTMTYGCQKLSLNKKLTNKELLKEQWRGKC